MAKKHFNLLVDKDLIKKAKENGIVLSRFFENSLQEYMSIINSKSNNTFFDNDINSRARGVAWHPSTLGW